MDPRLKVHNDRQPYDLDIRRFDVCPMLARLTLTIYTDQRITAYVPELWL